MRSTKAIIDLNKLDYNIKQLKNLINDQTGLMAVVKANAYGHGSIPVAYRAVLSGASWLAVATPEEGAQLREAGLQVPILVLGGIIEDSDASLIIDYNLTQTVFTNDTLKLLSEKASKQHKNVDVHIKIDSGMNRIGIKNANELKSVINTINNIPYINCNGIFTHFSESDSADRLYTEYQLDNFTSMLEITKKMGIKIKWIHAANSAAIIDYPNTYFNMVRAGISMYGYYPSQYVNKGNLNLLPILQWETKIIHIKNIQPGESVSYGRTFTASKSTRVATLPVGYADGYNRLLSNKGYVLINGHKAPVIGRICMDQTMVDISGIPDVNIGDNVILIGDQADKSISADDIAEICNTIPYEILTSISSRVPKVYI